MTRIPCRTASTLDRTSFPPPARLTRIPAPTLSPSILPTSFNSTLTNEFIPAGTYFFEPVQLSNLAQVLDASTGWTGGRYYNNGANQLPGIIDYEQGVPDFAMTYLGGPNGQYFRKYSYDVADNLTKQIRTHSIKVGFYFETTANNQVPYSYAQGNNSFNHYQNGCQTEVGTDVSQLQNNVANFLQGCTGFSQSSNANAVDLFFRTVDFYATDEWKATSKLTLTYGLRFDHLGPWTDPHGVGLAVWTPPTQNLAVDNITQDPRTFPGISWHQTNSSIPLSGSPTTTLFYSPRAGIAYDLYGSGKTVFRGGWGAYRFHDSYNDSAGPLSTSNGTQNYTGPTNRSCTYAQITAASQFVPTPSGPCLVTNSASVSPFGIYALDPTDSQQPVTYNYNFTVDQVFLGHTNLEISYVGNQSHHLFTEGNLSNQNYIPLGGLFQPDPLTGAVTLPGSTQQNVQDYRPYPYYTQVYVPHHIAYGNYNALQASLNKQKGSFIFNLNYTWSKALGIRGDYRTGAVGDPSTLRNNYGYLGFNRSQAVNATYSYQVGNAYHGNRIIAGLVNQWEISGITGVQTGPDTAVLNGTSNTNYNLSGGISYTPAGGTTTVTQSLTNQIILGTPDINLQPVVTCDPKYNLTQGSKYGRQYINQNCFALPKLGSNGNFELPDIHGPAYFNSDLTVQRSFRLTEQKNLQFRLAGFNFLNHPLPQFQAGSQPIALGCTSALPQAARSLRRRMPSPPLNRTPSTSATRRTRAAIASSKSAPGSTSKRALCRYFIPPRFRAKNVIASNYKRCGSKTSYARRPFTVRRRTSRRPKQCTIPLLMTTSAALASFSPRSLPSSRSSRSRILKSSPSSRPPASTSHLPVASPPAQRSPMHAVTSMNESGQVVQFAAGTGAQTIVAANQQGYGGPSSIAIDATKSYLYFPLGTSANNQWYSSQWSVTPISNCVPRHRNELPGHRRQRSLLYSYFGTAAVMGTDGYGDVFFSPTQGPNTNSIAEIGCSQGGQIACPSYPSGTNAAVLTGTLSKQPTSIAGDLVGNVFYTDGTGNLYEIAKPNVAAAASTLYTPTVAASGFVSAVAVSFDPAGNLFITDSNGYNSNVYYNTNLTAIVYEVPNEGGTLNFADMYTVANSLGVAAQPAVDGTGNLYYTSYPPSNEQNLTKTLRGTMGVPATNIGTTTPTTINYVFNANEAPASIRLTGSYGATVTSGGGTCAGGTNYSAGQSCTVIAKYTPTAPGAQPGVAQLLNSSDTPLISTAISGIGVGAAVTIDPGSQTKIGTSFKQPLGVSVDPNNNLYIADSSANTVTINVSGVAAKLPTGSLTLSGPSSAVADAQSNVYIADTGNNRIVEIPGSPSGPVTADAFALAISANGTALSGPSGLAIGPFGDLYIADTGNNRVVVVPNRSGSLAVSATVAYGTGLSGPNGVAVDQNGNVFVADSGNDAIVKLAAPLASGTQLNVVTGLSSPSAVAVDASGSLFVVNKGAASVEKFPFLSGLFGSPSFVGGTIAAPYGVALDVTGNLFVSDSTNGIVYNINRTAATLAFGNANLNTTSTPQTASISNGGNSPLTFSSPDYTASGATTQFAVSSDGCTGSTLVPGNACGITATFTPTENETNATENFAFSSNAYTAATLDLVGTGKTLLTTTTAIVLTAPSSGTLAAGVSASFTATVTSVGSPAPTGYVTFYVNGSQDGPIVPLTGTTASLTFPNGLPAGAVTVLAIYSGDDNYSGSQASINETVIGLNASLSFTVTTPYYSPQSTNDNPANTTGPSVPLTATLAVSSKIIPTGTVKFYSGTSASSTLIGIGALTPVSGGYQATATENSLRALTGTIGENGSIIANYTIFAVYSGDSFYVPESSAAVPLVVVGAPTTQAACATGDSATCSPNISGATFTITPTNPSLTISSSSVNGQTNGSVNLTVTSLGGWQGVLNFTCSNLPANSTCAPFPGSPLVNAITALGSATPTNVQFFINTNVQPTPPNASGFIWWVSGLFGIALLIARRRVARYGLHRLSLTLGLLLLLGGSIGTTIGCGSGTTAVRTPAGTTNVKVVVTAAQEVPCSSNCTVVTLNPKDADPITFNIALTVK